MPEPVTTAGLVLLGLGRCSESSPATPATAPSAICCAAPETVSPALRGLPEGCEAQFRRGAGDRPRLLDLFGAYIAEPFKTDDRFRADILAALDKR